MNESELRNHFNNEHPKEAVIYKGRGVSLKSGRRRLDIDVRDFIQPNDLMVKNFAESANIKGKSNDEKALGLQQFVCGFLKYIYDEQSEGFVEFWQFPFETIALKTGDCEDGAILTASAMIAAGIPNWRVRVAAGLVETGDPHAPTGGHAYACYLRETDNNWVVLDWCYYPDPNVPVASKPLLATHPKYKQLWFSFNDEFAWANKRFEITTIKCTELK